MQFYSARWLKSYCQSRKTTVQNGIWLFFFFWKCFEKKLAMENNPVILSTFSYCSFNRTGCLVSIIQFHSQVYIHRSFSSFPVLFLSMNAQYVFTLKPQTEETRKKMTIMTLVIRLLLKER